MKNVFFFLCSFFATTLVAQPQVELEVVVSGLTRPVDITNAGDARLFVVEQAGVIRVVDVDGDLLPAPFLTITGPVNDSGNERGLLGLAFHPDYANNGYFYVNYTGSGGDTYVSRFSVSDFNPNIADASSEVVLLTFDQPSSNHNGGDLAFGPDGYLYISTGDGGGANDTQNNSQTLSKYLGKMLRIDVDNGSPYSIPAENPFVDDPGTLDEIVAVGLRNPWRISFDRETGDLWIGDVGQELWEEIDFLAASDLNSGPNYGWRCYEGFNDFNTNNCGPFEDYEPPVFEYLSNMPTGCSVTGGYVYRGCRYPEMQGAYIFADYCSGRFWAITPDGQGGWDGEEVGDVANFQISSFGEDWNGELYAASLSAGTISRVVETQSEFVVETQVTDASCETASNGTIELAWTGNDPQSIDWGAAGTGAMLSDLTPGVYTGTVTTAEGCSFSVVEEVEAGTIAAPEIMLDQGILSVNNGPFATYQWYLNGEVISGATSASFTVIEGGFYTVEIVDTDGCGAESAELEVVVVNVQEVELVGQMRVGPNPASGELFYQLTILETGTLTLELYDMQGKQHLTQDLEVVPGVLEGSLQFPKLASGAYSLCIRAENDQHCLQLVLK